MKFKLKKIETPNQRLRSLTSPLYINGAKKLLQTLKSKTFPIEQYERIYQLIIKNRIKKDEKYVWEEIKAILQERQSDIPSVVFHNQNQINKYYIPYSSYEQNQQPKIYTHSVAIPQVIKKAYTLPLKSMNMYSKQNYMYIFSRAYYHTHYNFTFAENEILLKLLEKKYSDSTPDNNYPITHQVIQPPKNMIRYVDQTLKGWKVVRPSQDILQCEVRNRAKTRFEIRIRKKIFHKTSRQAEYEQWVYPNPVIYQRKALGDNLKNLNNIFQVKNIYQQELINRRVHYGISSCQNFPYAASSASFNEGSEDYSKYYNDSKYLSLKYDDVTMKKLKIGYTLEDKMGYYNSLLQEQMMINPYIYKWTKTRQYTHTGPNHREGNCRGWDQIEPNISPSFMPANFLHTLSDQYAVSHQMEDAEYNWLRNYMIFSPTKQTNLLSICYMPESKDKSYGFMHQISKYQIKFKISMYNFRTNEVMNPADYLMVRCLPQNGIQDFDDLMENPDIGITKRDNIDRDHHHLRYNIDFFGYNPIKYYDLNSTDNYADVMRSPTSLHYTGSCVDRIKYDYNKEQTYPAENDFKYKYYNLGRINCRKPSSYPQYVYRKIEQPVYLGTKLLKPNGNFRQFNFMFDKYGQFNTYRTLSTRYFKYNNKRYVDLFGDVSQTFSEEESASFPEGTKQVVVTIDKNFQGNSILAFMINDKMSNVVSKYDSGKSKSIENWYIGISDVQIKKLPSNDIFNGSHSSSDYQFQEVDYRTVYDDYRVEQGWQGGSTGSTGGNTGSGSESPGNNPGGIIRPGHPLWDIKNPAFTSEEGGDIL